MNQTQNPTITTTITADKAGFLDHLREKQGWATSNAEHCDTVKERTRWQGVAAGLEDAIRAVEAWEIPGTVEVSTEELANDIGAGMHTGLRKGSDAESSGDLWKAIADSKDSAWSDAAEFCADGLKYMGYTITKAAE